jgi:uncharacterized membrane protein
VTGLYAFSVWLHIVAAATWVGSMIFFAAVVVPVLRRSEVESAAPRLMHLLGARFRTLGWVALAVLVATGISNLYALGCKLALVSFVLVATAAHDALAGKKALQALQRAPRSPEALRVRRVASWLGRVVLAASLAIVFFAIALVRGFL